MTVNNAENYRIVCVLTGPDSQDVANTWYMQTTLDSPMSDADFADAIVTGLSNIYSTANAQWGQNYEPAYVAIDRVAVAAGEIYIVRSLGSYSWDAGFLPASTSDSLPSGVAFLVSFATTGIKTLGRKFFGAQVESNVTPSGHWETGLITVMSTLADYFLDDIVLATGKSVRTVVYGKRAAAWLPLLGYIIKNIPSYQRRRKAGVGS